MKQHLHQYLKVEEIVGKSKGVITNVDILAGSLVVVGKPREVSKERTNMSFQVDVNSHVLLDDPAERLNHSCNPNLGVRLNSFGGYNFYARRDIEKGEELTWCYPTTEYESIAVPKCFCGSSNCLKQIKGWEYLPAEMKQEFKDQNFIPDFILQMEKIARDNPR